MTVSIRQITVAALLDVIPLNNGEPIIGGQTRSGGLLTLSPGQWILQQAPAGSVSFLGNDYYPTTAGLNDAQGWQSGVYESRIYQEGSFGLLFPNAAGSDGKQHLERFGILKQPGQTALYRPSYEWIEVYDNADLLYVGTPTKGSPTRKDITIEGEDAFWLLRKTREYYAGYWQNAPRDVWEHYTQVWRVFLAEGFDDKSQFPANASGAVNTTGDGRMNYQYVKQGPQTGKVRIAPGVDATEGFIGGAAGGPAEFTLGYNSSNSERFNHWQWRVMFSRPKFGSETVPPYGDNASVRVGLRHNGDDFLWIQMQEKHTYVRGPDDSPPSTGPARFNAMFQTDAGNFEVIVEGHDRWVYFFVNQTFVAAFPVPHDSYVVQPFVGLRTGDASNRQYIDVDNFCFRRCRPFLMRDENLKGSYKLGGPVASGGLWGRYYDDKFLKQREWYRQMVFSPHHTQPYLERLDEKLNFEIGPGGIDSGQAEPNAKWQGGGMVSDLWWSVRWTGSIYLDLANTDVHVRTHTQEEGARVWIGKTRMGEWVIDNWYTNLGSDQTSDSLRAHIGVNPDTGLYESGWYPILVETGNRNVHGAEFSLKWDVGGSWDFVPSDKLSPYGIVYDQMREQSHYEALTALAETWGYQMAVEPRSLESGAFPGILRPRVRVGHDTDKVLTDADLEDYGAVVTADDVADAILGDGSGMADENSQSGQMTAEAMNYLAAEGQPMLLTEYEQWGDINFAPMLQQRANSLLALRSSAWEEVTAQPAGMPEMRDTFPLTGDLALLYWTAGDGVRINLPRLGVVDASPRQILGVQRPFYQVGLRAPSVSFRLRPRNMRDFMRNLQRRFMGKQRTYQGQYVRQTSTPGTSPAQGGMEARLALPMNMADIARTEVTIFKKDDGETPWYLYVNGVKMTDFPPVTEAGTYDITPYTTRYIDAAADAERPYVGVVFKTS